MSGLEFLLQKHIIIALAIAGASLVTLGAYLKKNDILTRSKVVVLLIRIGYFFTWISVFIFILSGFLGNH
ncbi:uncharacterized protein METZ01_LOCUS157060 [marine metagenome]|uniref:Uncharacterized protein n=1 Tax=marine metagenome TaxID=408172 RepID=A0A382ARS7_9ZZZZ